MQLPVLTIQDAVERQLCAGCGACAAMAPDALMMCDVTDYGRRPAPTRSWDDVPAGLTALCPGVHLQRSARAHRDERRDLRAFWGPVLAVYECHAGDDAVRHAASSGGIATALGQFAIEQLGFHGVLHTAAKPDQPWLNETVMSTTVSQLASRSGSRYAPASPCDGLQQIADAPGPCVLIGKPCDVAGANKARQLNPYLDANLGLTIGFFCAGTPTTRGTLHLMERAGVDDASHVHALRYRGNGWPGDWQVTFTDGRGNLQTRTMSYEQSWGALERHRPWRCRICPDHVGEFADVAVGDGWHRKRDAGDDAENPGTSLLIVRTQRGRDLVERAIAAGAIVVTSHDATLLAEAQPELMQARASVWGRLLAMRLAGLPTPIYRGMSLWRTWLALPARQAAQSIIGTWRRIGRYRLRERIAIKPAPAHASASDRARGRSAANTIIEPKEHTTHAHAQA